MRKMPKLTIDITENQANIILRALGNESIDDMAERGEYSYARCHTDMAKKIEKARGGENA